MSSGDDKQNMINKFISTYLSDQKFLKHSDLNINLDLKITSLFNYDNLLTDENNNYINKEFSNNYKYFEEINKEKKETLIAYYKEKQGEKNIKINEKELNKILKLDQNKKNLLFYQLPEFEIYFVAKLFVNGLEIKPEFTTKLIFTSTNINQTISIRYNYKDLTLDSYIIVYIYSMQLPEENSLLGETKIELFDDKLNLRRGRQIFKIKNLNKEKENEKFNEENKNINNINTNINNKDEEIKKKLEEEEENKKIEYELNLLVKSFYKSNKTGAFDTNYIRNTSDNKPANEVDQILKSDNPPYESVLDTFYYTNENEIELKNEYRKNFETKLNLLLSKTKETFLEIEFPSFNNRIIFEEAVSKDYKKVYKSVKYKENNNLISFSNWICDPKIIKEKGNDLKEKEEIKIFNKDNPIIDKFSALSHVSDDSLARDIKVTPYDRERINELLSTPDFYRFEKKDLTLFWIYRYELLKNNTPYALTKILNSVNWGDAKNENEFINNILNKWVTVEISDLLYMLSRKFCINEFYNKNDNNKENNNTVININGMKEVRKYAALKLENLSDMDLNFILLQLVQALRYEDYEDSLLRKILIEKCSSNKVLASSFFWFIMCECEDDNNPNNIINNNNINDNLNNINNNNIEKPKKTVNDFYNDIKEEFLKCLSDSKKKNLNDEERKKREEIHNCIVKEILFKQSLIKISKQIKSVSNKVDRQKEKLRAILSGTDKASDTENDTTQTSNIQTETFPLPLEPNVEVKGVDPQKCTIFRSNLRPVKYTFNITPETQKYNLKDNPAEYSFIFKYGDDLRQDQLILQMISYMDSILKKVHLDYEFTTYKVLATSKSDGFVEFVPNSTTIYDIVTNQKMQLKQYIESHAKEGDNEDKQKRIDSYINSSAGYSIVTFILGIGDRHLENLMIDDKGRLFHIDFGYILGKDIKVAAPLIKLSKEMLEPMGGKGSPVYENFKQKCVNAYWILRDRAREIVNMFYLMIDSGIPQLNNLDDLIKLHDKFVPGYSKQDASNSILNKIDESANAFGGSMIDFGHRVAGLWKY